MTWEKANIIIDGQKMEVPAPAPTETIDYITARTSRHSMRTGSSIGSKPAIPCGTTRSTEKRAISLTGIQDS